MKDRPDSPDSDKKGFVIIPLTQNKDPDSPAIEPLFKYPSKKYFGMMRYTPSDP